jgi:hypothetical protein
MARPTPAASRIRVDIGRAGRWDDATVWQEFSGVVEEDDAVAQQAPSLLGVGGNGVRGVPVDSVGRGALRLGGTWRTSKDLEHPPRPPMRFHGVKMILFEWCRRFDHDQSGSGGLIERRRAATGANSRWSARSQLSVVSTRRRHDLGDLYRVCR